MTNIPNSSSKPAGSLRSRPASLSGVITATRPQLASLCQAREGGSTYSWSPSVRRRRRREVLNSRQRLCVGATTHTSPVPPTIWAVTNSCANRLFPALVGKERITRRAEESRGDGSPGLRLERNDSCGGQSCRTGGSPKVMARAALGRLEGRTLHTALVSKPSPPATGAQLPTGTLRH